MDMSRAMSTSSSLLALKSISSRSSATSASTTTSTSTECDSDYTPLSSGMTTPADDDVRPLDRLLKGYADQNGRRASLGTGFRAKPSSGLQDTPAPPSRSLSVAMRKVRRVARSLTVFRRKRADGVQLAFPSGTPTGPNSAGDNFYSLPNGQLSEQDLRSRSNQTQPGVRRSGTVTGSTIIESAFRRPRAQGFRLSNFSTLSRGVVLASTPAAPTAEKSDPLSVSEAHLGFNVMLTHVLRILFFLPWCAAVGGALLLFPAHLDLVAFAPGYLLRSPRGIRRFSHWADCALQHVMIFLALTTVLVCYDKTVGVSLGGALVSRFVYVWNDFRVDRNIPLGEDDRQTLFLVATDRAFVGDEIVVRDQSGVAVRVKESSMD
ncbi:hypothetical protein BV22DRAFT_308914 [Leucogyrophana mollusca]|uniref:Uncharacterized protein n=1 Tax=Leucogyrophana mollusca TaxID=85980 RepID=A0ACB8BP69_9AGAM|nr:hypothetical protein BV22DRAFT_308914 [Leucogyrophana mollusca]